MAVTAAVFFVLFLFFALKPVYCAGTEEDYTNGLKIIEERVILTSIIPIDYDKLNEIVANYSTCPSGIDCKIIALRINLYGLSNQTENDKWVLLTKMVNQIYTEMPFLYDRTISFHFKALDNQEDSDVVYVLTNRWTRR